jgi:hypothetical protein
MARWIEIKYKFSDKIGGRMNRLLKIGGLVNLLGLALISSVTFSKSMGTDSAEALAQEKQRLSDVLKEKDQQLFESIFGRCNIELIDAMIADSFEFYHDKDGITESKTAFMKQLKTGKCANQTQDSNKQSNYQAYRVLHEDSLNVFPMYNREGIYAVFQTGVHSFYEANNGGNLVRGSTAKFSHLWKLEKDQWRLTRVISYDHQTPESWKY